MLLLYIIGHTYFNSSFIVVLIFMALEEFKSYQIFLEQVKKLFVEVPLSNIIIVDYELILTNKIKEFFLSAIILLCLYYINKNIIKIYKQDFINE